MKDKWWIGVLVIVVLLASIAVVFVPRPVVHPAPVSAPAGGPPPPPYPEIPVGTAQYEVTGDGVATTITFIIDNDEANEHNVTLPWKKSSGTPWMSLSAQRGEGPGYITCRITGHGQVLAVDTASGPFAICLATATQDKDEGEDPVEEEGPSI
jgi:hypothetical protein